MRKVPVIFRVILKVKYDTGCINSEDFSKQQVILHASWQQLKDINTDNDASKIVHEHRFNNNNNNILSYQLDQVLQI